MLKRNERSPLPSYRSFETEMEIVLPGTGSTQLLKFGEVWLRPEQHQVLERKNISWLIDSLPLHYED